MQIKNTSSFKRLINRVKINDKLALLLKTKPKLAAKFRSTSTKRNIFRYYMADYVL